MANFQHDMSADRWSHDELIDNLRLAGEACDKRRADFHNKTPDGAAFTAWTRHTLAVAAAVRLLEIED